MDEFQGPERPPLSEIEDLVKQHLVDAEILSIYLFGSHLHRCNTATSDLDLLIFVGGPYFLGCRVWHDEAETINLNVYHKEHVLDLIKQNFVWIIMLKWLPAWCIWKESFPFAYDVKIPALRRAVLMDSSHNLAKAKRLWQIDGDYRKSKKNVIHGLRWLLFGTQILTEGKITDFTAGNEYWKEIMENTSDSWDDYELKYRPIYKTLMHTIRHDMLPEFVGDQNESYKLEVLKYIKERDLGSLAFDYSIVVSSHKKYSNIVHLRADKYNSPLDQQIVQECCPLILDQDKGYEVLATGYRPFENFDEVLEKKCKFSEAYITPKVEGKLAIVYYYNEDWHVATTLTPEGSEVFTMADGVKEDIKIMEGWKKNIKKFENNLSWVISDEEEHQKTTFEQLFWETWKLKNYSLPQNQKLTYLFQVNHKMTNAVWKERECNIVLHGVQDLEALEFISPQEVAALNGWNTVTPIAKDLATSWETLREVVHQLNPSECIGFVIVDKKQKIWANFLSPQYYALKELHTFNDYEKNWKLMLDLVRVNANHRFIATFPQWHSLYTEVLGQYQEFCSGVQTVFDSIKDSSNADFAKTANTFAFYGILFDMKKLGLVDVKEYLTKQRLGWIINIMRGQEQGRARRGHKPKSTDK